MIAVGTLPFNPVTVIAVKKREGHPHGSHTRSLLLRPDFRGHGNESRQSATSFIHLQAIFILSTLSLPRNEVVGTRHQPIPSPGHAYYLGVGDRINIPPPGQFFQMFCATHVLVFSTTTGIRFSSKQLVSSGIRTLNNSALTGFNIHQAER